MKDKLIEFNVHRKDEYKKSIEDENFLFGINRILMKNELEFYKNDLNEEFPLLFVFGLPRTGTTLLTQLVAQTFDIGYINNFIARFWLAPITGIKLSKIFFGNNSISNFNSDYGKTESIIDIHEFGYFWRYWLKKENISDIVKIKQRENEIDWDGLKRVLLNIIVEFGKGLCCKNIFGAYHIKKFIEFFDKVMFLYIERDPLDVAISILDARKKYYNDLNLWWSYVPIEYNMLKDQPVMEQIAGQIYYLNKFYENQFKLVNNKNILRISYKDLCNRPLDVLKKIKMSCFEICNYNLNTINESPQKIVYKTYKNRQITKDRFKTIFNDYGLDY